MGIDCATQTDAAHERYHGWVNEQWLPGGLFVGKNQTQINFQTISAAMSGGHSGHFDEQASRHLRSLCFRYPTPNKPDTYKI